MPNEGDWREKYERSENSRQKLRKYLELLKEKAVNTAEVLRRQQELEQQLEAERNARRKAEATTTKLREEKAGMQRKLEVLETQLKTLQKTVDALVAAKPRPGSTSTTLTYAQLAARVQAHDNEILRWKQAFRAVLGETSSKEKETQILTVAPPVGEDARARAVALLQANGSKRQTTAPEKQKKRVRLAVEGGLPQVESLPLGKPSGKPRGEASLGASAYEHGIGMAAEAIPASDAAVCALRPIVEAVDDVQINTIIEAVTSLLSSPQTTLAALSSAMLGCAASRPQARFASPGLSPDLWFGTHKGGNELDTTSSFVATWCNDHALEYHVLPWLLHCACELDNRMLLDEGQESAIPEMSMRRALALELSKTVLEALMLRQSLHTVTEMCAAAAAAAALWRILGDANALQAFLVDVVVSRPGEEFTTLPVAAAVIESWAEAVPKKGVLGTALLSVLRQACIDGMASDKLDIREARTWLLSIGGRLWGWDPQQLPSATSVEEGKKQLAKFAH